MTRVYHMGSMLSMKRREQDQIFTRFQSENWQACELSCGAASWYYGSTELRKILMSYEQIKGTIK